MTDPTAPAWKRALAASGPWLLLVAVAASAALTCWYAWSLQHYGLHSVRGTKVFYDQYHVVRHKVEGRNKRGAWAYHEVSGYNEFLRTLERAGYDVHVHRKGMGRITPGTLDDYDIFFIGEQTHHATFMTDEEREVVFDFVREGGGMWATIEHTDAHGMTEWFNPWMEGTGIQARKDSICEPNGTTDSRDWVELRTVDHPTTEGVEVIYTCNGCSLDTEHALALSSEDSWSDAWNPDDPPVHNGDNVRNEGELGGPLVGVAAAEYGQGRIMVTCDHNLFSNPTLYTGDHHRFLLQAMDWLGDAEHTNPDAYSLPLAALLTLVLAGGAMRGRRWPHALVAAGLGVAVGLYGAWDEYEEPDRRDILVTDTHAPTHKVRSKDAPDFFTFFEHLMKERDTYAWLGRSLEPGYDALYLNSPTLPLSEADLAVVDGYLAEGRTVVYLATRRSQRSPAGAQLLERFGVDVRLTERPDADVTRVYAIQGPAALTHRAKKLRVPTSTRHASIGGEGVEVLVRLARDVERVDFIAAKPHGGGRFVVVAQADLLGNRNIRKKEYRMHAVDLSMNLAAWSVGR